MRWIVAIALLLYATSVEAKYRPTPQPPEAYQPTDNPYYQPPNAKPDPHDRRWRNSVPARPPRSSELEERVQELEDELERQDWLNSLGR